MAEHFAEKDARPPLVVGTINTRHPDHYLLVNEHDGSRWRLAPDGEWLRDTPPEVGQS